MTVIKVSISVSPQTYAAVREVVAAGEFRSVSHFFEEAAKKLLREEKRWPSVNGGAVELR